MGYLSHCCPLSKRHLQLQNAMGHCSLALILQMKLYESNKPIVLPPDLSCSVTPSAKDLHEVSLRLEKSINSVT